MENPKIEMTAEEISATLEGVKKLYRLYTTHSNIFMAIGRKNGKSQLAYEFTKNYYAIIKAYEKAEKKQKKKMGYIPLSAFEQCLYIIKCGIVQKARRLRDRFRLWRKPKKGCRRCCLWCKYFEHCRSEMEEADNE